MTKIMLRALHELKLDIIVVDRLLETTSTANYLKSTCRTKNACTIIIIHNSPGNLPVQSVACESKKSTSSVTITANKMDANNKTVDSKSTGSKVVYLNQTQDSSLITGGNSSHICDDNSLE